MTDKGYMGKRLKAARKSKGLTGERLAESCYINATYLRQIEAGRKLPSLPVFITLCKALEVSPTFLLVDSIDKNELSGLGELAALWSTATPDQLELVTAMIRSVLEHLRKE
ncbi:helix-turn-helix domain-containing protein [Butyricicoccus faecihominis]|uniref:helix-turn-helix domain-containing protein n=1 Tax=Butyricicoccus faecihominis TaxID=1712515 RepID=UPI0024798DB5|nr:helix-turn-helix transcriptional regulator [Butyricicoccus faecihominis]MCQ5130955.1 helix-turn-helix domain-containing protein [Butyricicoccus faecihominis]